MPFKMDDWSNITPLTENEALQAINAYIDKKGLVAIKIPRTEGRQEGKRPDWKIMSKDKSILYAYAEVKCPGHNIDEELGVYKWDTIYNKLVRYTNESVKQFKDFDCQHTIPWVLVIASNHPQLKWVDFYHRLLGMVVLGGQVLHKHYESVGGNDDYSKWKDLDLILWLQVNHIDRHSIYQWKEFLCNDSEILEIVKQFADMITPKKKDGMQ